MRNSAKIKLKEITMDIWRFHLITDKKSNLDPFDFVKRKGEVGIGWQLSKKPNSKDEAYELAKIEHSSKGSSAGYNAILYRMQIDDLVWTRDTNGFYYLGRVISDWEYNDSIDYINSDYVNIRKTDSVLVGTQVPGKVKNNFILGQAIRSIYSETLSLYSRYLYNQISNTNFYQISETDCSNLDIFDLLDFEDLEDIIALYLQITKKLCLLPSSRGRLSNTKFYEFELLNTENFESVYVQVKGGIQNPLITNDYISFNKKIYLFSSTSVSGNETENVKIISKPEILDFLNSHDGKFPQNIQLWLDFIKKAKAN
ncbi:hypothetical protein EHQ94_02075 [Leptospira meyeri]|uniref:hypothetical protein n=1 Tax=Leptospira meyeri TaxID=29508 RepID=UPI001083B74A|nr:hypothetical protein [Leptospira meyeri]TGM65847.1 hypothetical protein EHQ93_08855 [Leptospira meyeri]TGM72059.1 hypothetical protein EHQ94_02075 [Leptospira meyeri]